MIRIVLIPAVNYMQHSGKNNCSKCTVKGEARSAPFGSVNATHKEQRTSGKSLARRHWRFLCGRKELVLQKNPRKFEKLAETWLSEWLVFKHHFHKVQTQQRLSIH